MSTPPRRPKIYHITHVDNLVNITDESVILSDAQRIEQGMDCTLVGMSDIKQRRLRLDVDCHPGTKVGEYVPFYFCPRSIMLYILYMGNHPDISYRQGQGPIVHLQSDLMETVRWAEENGVRWAFSNRNAGGYIVDFFNNLDDLDEVNWDAVSELDFRDFEIREGKQAEFLLYESFPWELVEKIGVINTNMVTRTNTNLQNADHLPIVEIKNNDWYF